MLISTSFGASTASKVNLVALKIQAIIECKISSLLKYLGFNFARYFNNTLTHNSYHSTFFVLYHVAFVKQPSKYVHVFLHIFLCLPTSCHYLILCYLFLGSESLIYFILRVSMKHYEGINE